MLVLAIVSVVFLTVYVYAVDSTVITIDDVTIEYSPEGYYPKASVSAPLTDVDVAYLVIDKNTSEPVELPLVNVGEYVVKAYATLNGEEVSDTANVTITPVKATIYVEYDKLRYTGDDVIPEYKVYPEWTADYFQINVTYTFYKEKNPSSATEVNAPHALGKYFVKMTPYGTGDNILCDGKAYILTIAEYGGKKLSESKASAPVASGITGKLKETTYTYNGEQQSVICEMTPKCAAVDIYYRLIGSNEAPTMDVPMEPGEYEVTAVLCNTVLDRSTMIINKKTPKYEMVETTYVYSPSGVVPRVRSLDDINMTFDITAYLVDENDAPISSETLPLKKTGKYLLVINPSDVEHYEAIFSPEYIYVEKCTPRITSEAKNYNYDGFSKNVTYSVYPSWVESEITYYIADKNGEATETLGKNAPINVGSYIAEIKVKETENVAQTSLKVYFSIEPSTLPTVSRPAESETEYFFIGIASPRFVFVMVAIPLALIALFFVFVFVQRKKR